MAISPSSSAKIGSMASFEGGTKAKSPSPMRPSLSSPMPAEELYKLEAKRCDLKLPKKFMTQARMSTGGRIPRKMIAKRHIVIDISDDEEPKIEAPPIIVPPRRSKGLLGKKRKNYEEKTPEPNDFGGCSDWEDDRSPGSWGNGVEDNDFYAW